MGWKGSMIIIQDPGNVRDDKKLLSALGLDNYTFSEETLLDECLYPDDNSINIGYFNNTIIICDGFQIIDDFINDVTTYKERQLISIYPESEILSIAFLSTTNFHGYSLIDKGHKVRVKAIDADNGKILDGGEFLSEEIVLYNKGFVDGNTMYWSYEDLPDDKFEENQLLEDFSFEVAKRLLGVRIDADEGDQLLFETPFKKYLPSNQLVSSNISSMRGKWTGYYEYGPLYGDELYGKKVAFNLDLSDIDDGTFEGECQDLEGVGSQKGFAKISGFINDNFISFTKEYVSAWMVDETSEELTDHKVLNSQLAYKGTYNSFKHEFTGEWEINSNIKFPDGSSSEQIDYGIWSMKRG
ncbi:hypothetical protein ESA94_09280 [Lacibacter luteus]|uniref:Uncharacterized protein n=1 Tax=Lacibacter luteus TaxID=2508719 RepID=A0A4V1M7N0_9BACT|nr:hypothetical protein [Lacibacter luteus]RXK60645.1 hypothetical protein ESA94_09280 [Lacibacter luteus]